ncbi:MAG: GatB/YqeY domain-containing protein [Clostridia bacterium]|nr:GatB/YqeY domain-containing protein [Clostridia bacterium]
MLKEQLLQDFKEAMKEKNELKKNTIMMVRAAILQIEKDTQKEVSDNEILEILSKEIKKRKDSLEDILKSGREDLISQVNEEMSIIKAYLPAELTDEELNQIIDEVIAQTGATSMKDMGKVMQAAKTKTAGRADNKKINEIVKQKLS